VGESADSHGVEIPVAMGGHFGLIQNGPKRSRLGRNNLTIFYTPLKFLKLSRLAI
jgi:hypothetical protein